MAKIKVSKQDKLCPVCGKPAYELNGYVGCQNVTKCILACSLFKPKEWNSRPRDKRILKLLDKINTLSGSVYYCWSEGRNILDKIRQLIEGEKE